MKKYFLNVLFLLFALILSGCKNLINDSSAGVNSDGERSVTVFINSQNSRAIAYPDISDLTVAAYVIKGNGGSAGEKKYTLTPSNGGYNLSFKASTWTFEVIAYKTDKGDGTYSDPVAYVKKDNVSITSSTTTLSFNLELITKEYTSGELQGEDFKGSVKFSLTFPSVRTEDYSIAYTCDKNESSNCFGKNVTLQKTATNTLILDEDNLKPGKHTVIFSIKGSSNIGLIYVATYYIAVNITTTVSLDLSGETLNPDYCAELADIGLYEDGSNVNLVSYSGTETTMNCNGVSPEKSYNLILTMKAPSQNISVKIKKAGESEFTTSDTPEPSAEFIDVTQSYAQVLTYNFVAAKLINNSGDSSVQITVSKGAETKIYTLNLSDTPIPELEDTVITHPINISSMTALPVPVSNLDGANDYVITTENQLRALAEYVNNGNSVSGKTFVLGNSIALTSEWTPIGTDTSAFDGDFDGNNYKISALTISSASADSGLFGVLRKSNINNLTVEGAITGDSQRLGGITGCVTGATGEVTKISNCISNVNITSSVSCAAGIIGYVKAGEVYVVNCINFGSITATYYCTGIIGVNCAKAYAQNCANLGLIKSTLYSAAGILYSANNESYVHNCYNGNSIQSLAAETVGAIGVMDTGKTINVSYCYYLNGSATNAIGGATNDDAVPKFTNPGDTCKLSTSSYGTTDLKTALNTYGNTGNIGYQYSKWLYTVNATYKGFPVFKDTMARLNAEPEGDGSNDLHTPIASEWKNISEYVDDSGNIIDGVSEESLSGETIVVSDVVGLSKINKLLGISSLSNVTFIMDGDINFTENKPEGFNNIYGTNQFSGKFNGNNYRIYNYSFNITSSTVGFIAKLNNGCIENLTIEGETLTAANGCGAFAGATYGDMNVINNCTSKVTLSGSKRYYGGFVGSVEGGTYIRNCVNFSNITSSSEVGGFVGFVTSDTNLFIENCANYGNVTATSSYGAGFVGYTSSQYVEIYNSFNYGTATTDPILCKNSTISEITIPAGTMIFYNSNNHSSSVINSAKSFTPNETKYVYDTDTDLAETLSAWARNETTSNCVFKEWGYFDINLNGIEVKGLLFK